MGTQNVQGLYRSQGGYQAAASDVESLMPDQGLHILVLTVTQPWRERYGELIEAMNGEGLEWRATDTQEEHQRVSGAMVVWCKNGGLRCLRNYTDKEGRGVATHMGSDKGGGFLVMGMYGVATPDKDAGRQFEAKMLMVWAADSGRRTG